MDTNKWLDEMYDYAMTRHNLGTMQCNRMFEVAENVMPWKRGWEPMAWTDEYARNRHPKDRDR